MPIELRLADGTASAPDATSAARSCGRASHRAAVLVKPSGVVLDEVVYRIPATKAVALQEEAKYRSVAVLDALDEVRKSETRNPGWAGGPDRISGGFRNCRGFSIRFSWANDAPAETTLRPGGEW